jgi:hypothetical protein
MDALEHCESDLGILSGPMVTAVYVGAVGPQGGGAYRVTFQGGEAFAEEFQGVEFFHIGMSSAMDDAVRIQRRFHAAGVVVHDWDGRVWAYDAINTVSVRRAVSPEHCSPITNLGDLFTCN